MIIMDNSFTFNVAGDFNETYGYLNALNLQNAFAASLSNIMDFGQHVTVRGSNTKELTNVKIVIRNPLQRYVFLRGRKDSVPAKCAEFLWMLAGRDDIDWLSYYMPRAPQFSDDGICWRGAYGPRIRHWNGNSRIIDQLRYVVNLLTEDPTSRQAVVSIWNPKIDVDPGKDIPCNINLQFLLRRGKLSLAVTQRSSDAIWGYSGVDVFNWTSLLQMMASWVGADVGEFHHSIGSMHVYERHYDDAKIITDYAPQKGLYELASDAELILHPHNQHTRSPAHVIGMTYADMQLEAVFDAEALARATDEFIYSDILFAHITDPMLLAYTQAMIAYIYLKRYDYDQDGKGYLIELVDSMEYTDLRLAIVLYIARQHKDFINDVVLPSYVLTYFNAHLGL